MKKIISIIVLLFAINANAATVTVSGDCSASAVQTAITGASAGDVIDVTCTGTVEWSSTVTISGGKTLKGGGAKTGNANTTTGTWPLTINITHNSATAVQITNVASQQVNRLTGFKFQGSGRPTNIVTSNGQGVGSDSKGAFRIDNNYFNEPAYAGRVIRTDGSAGKLTGVLDHNVFYYKETSTPGYGNISYQNTSRTGSATYCVGYEAWKRAIGFGSDDFVFYEDNYFLNSGIETSEGGGKIVSRYNYYTTDYAVGISGVDGHGADTLRQYCIGVVAAEFYNNTLSGSGIAHAVNMRGGQWMVHDNTISNGVLQIDEYRLRSSGSLDWKACSGSFCCPTTPAMCDVQQPTIDDFAACYPVLNQLSNTYLWSNSGRSPQVYASNATITYYIAENREYWNASTGLAANIPATCTTGAGYWATDTSILYKCVSNNTWGQYYTPYTYPHPLRTEDEPPADTTRPAFSTASINSAGTGFSITLTEDVTVNTNTGFTLHGCSGGAATLTYVSEANGVLSYTISRTIQQSETGCHLDYTTGANYIEDAAGNDLDTFADGTVVNNSTQSTPPLTTLTISSHAGATAISSPSGISCGSTCTYDFDSGTSVVVQGYCLANYQNMVIGGDCNPSTGAVTASGTPSCTVTCTKINADAKIGTGAGHVVGSGAAHIIR